MGVVRLGKLKLRWCFHCNLPVLEADKCGICSGETEPVELTPPGDVRPAFDCDLKLARSIVDSQFGAVCGIELIPDDIIVLLNKSPALDRMDELIFNGKVQGTLRYDPGEDYKFILRMEGAQRIENKISKNWIVVDPGAVEPIIKGANALCVGITEASPEIAVGDEVVVMDSKRKAIAVGKAKVSGKEMVGGKGMGVKTRWYGREEKAVLPRGRTWDDVIAANSWFFEKKIPDTLESIRKVVEKEGMDVAVSFSGGKDSLATLLLALDAGLTPKIIFVDTGLEFPETVAHVNEVAEKYRLELISENAEQVFFRFVDMFGPPGKDFRWCCKTCKLGPTVRLINKNFPDGVLSLIGQRAYESEQRARKGRKWTNPWVPGQVGFSPIQDWTALHVWLYIFSRKAPYNIWYDRGLERIGCWLCPASDLADLEIVKQFHPNHEQWEGFLASYRDKRGYPEEWQSLGLWRWRKLPKGVREFLDRENIAITRKNDEEETEEGFDFIAAEGYQPCQGGVSIEGMFSRSLDMERVVNLLNILGECTYDEETDSCRVGDTDVFGEGGVVARGRNEKSAKRCMKNVKDIILRAHLCVGCGICTGRCEQGALYVDEKVKLDEDKCIHCHECLGPCPVIGYGEREFEF